jgi:hypothetical protein
MVRVHPFRNKRLSQPEHGVEDRLPRRPVMGLAVKMTPETAADIVF